MTEPMPGAWPQPPREQEPEPDAEAGFEPVSDTEAGTGAEARAEVDADFEPEPEADADVEPEADAGFEDAWPPEPAAADPVPLGVARTPTGDDGIDAQLDRLADADHLAASGHLEVYEDVHRGLRDTLTELDRRPGPPPPGAGPAPAPPARPYDNRS